MRKLLLSLMIILAACVLHFVGSSAATPVASTCGVHVVDARELMHLAVEAERGNDSVRPDSALALKYLRQAADSALPEALNLLGYKHITGVGAPKDAQLGLKLIEKAAELGDAKAFSNLGWLLADGRLVEQDYGKALYWLRRGAERNLAVAQTLLADMYRTGSGLNEADTLRADSLYLRAISQGWRDADMKMLSMNAARWDRLTPREALILGNNLYEHNALYSATYLLRKAQDSYPAEAYYLLADAASRGLVPSEIPESLTVPDLILLYYLQSARAGNPASAWILADTLGLYPQALDSLADEVNGLELSQHYWESMALRGGITDPIQVRNYKINVPADTLEDPLQK